MIVFNYTQYFSVPGKYLKFKRYATLPIIRRRIEEKPIPKIFVAEGLRPRFRFLSLDPEGTLWVRSQKLKLPTKTQILCLPPSQKKSLTPIKFYAPPPPPPPPQKIKNSDP